MYFNLGADYEDGAGHLEDMRGGGDLLDDIFEEWDYPEDSDDHPGSSSNSVQMDGPALTVLEGTVTPGVDVLLGLDVLQDWEAEIRMGSKQSITVKKRERGSTSIKSGNNSFVIPFSSRASSSRTSSAQGRQVRGGAASRQRHRQDHPSRPRIPASDRYRRGAPARHHRPSEAARRSAPGPGPADARHTDRDDEEEERYYLSPRSSTIESDLDLLDQTSPREFPSSDSGGRLSQMRIDELEEGLSGRGARHVDIVGPGEGSNDSGDDDEDDYLPEEEDMGDDEFDCDMSGL